MLLLPLFSRSQDIALYTQINGRYDFTFIGNTMNPNENSFQTTPSIFTSSSANLNLSSNDIIERAYLYWAGCGTGDFDIKLNGNDLTADIQYNIIGTSSELNYFSAFKDITSLVQSTGNGIYTLSDLDVNSFISEYFNTNRTNFAGWAILVVYENTNLPLNQINIYQGLEALSPNVNLGFIDSKTIQLDNLYLISNSGAKIGFIAWEGDLNISVSESLKLTTNQTYTLSNTLNPPINAFNGTNTEANLSNMYNMDLDIYSIENYVQNGMTSATVSLESGQDYVMLNTVVTKLNSQLPDATIVLEDYLLTCNSREIPLNYTVYNVNSTEILAANTPIAFYADGILVGTSQTQTVIPIGGNEIGNTLVTIPNTIPLNFTLTAIVDDIGDGTSTGIITELVETNNDFTLNISLLVSPEFNALAPLLSCNLGLSRGFFDFSDYEQQVKTDALQSVTFHETYEDALQAVNPIINITNYEAQTTPKEIFIRIEDNDCFAVTSFLLQVRNCPPVVYNAVSPNNDNSNDTFFIDGLRDIFVNFRLEIYNRWGKLLWIGDNNKPDWNGYVSDGIGTKIAPDGTYYYILYLNDPSYPEPLNGYLYLSK